MPFGAKWMEGYALEFIKGKVKGWLPDLVREYQEQVALMEKQGILLWPNLSVGLKTKAIERAFPYSATILALNVDDVTDVILEALSESGLQMGREWLKLNLLAFRSDLAIFSTMT